MVQDKAVLIFIFFFDIDNAIIYDKVVCFLQDGPIAQLARATGS